MIKIKRVYEEAESTDGIRILVDKWPRGLTKDSARINLWLNGLVPSLGLEQLQKWSYHNIKKWIEFKEKYTVELKRKTSLLNKIKELEKVHKVVTLLYCEKDKIFNNARVIYNLLKNNKLNKKNDNLPKQSLTEASLLRASFTPRPIDAGSRLEKIR